MAERFVYFPLIFAVVTHICCAVSPGQAETNGGLYCWKDSDVTRATNQSCLTREEHPPNMMSTTAGDHNNTDDNPGNETTAAPATKMAVKRCMTYTNYTSSNDTTLHWLPAGSTNSSKIVQSNLVRVRSCDFDGLCDNKTLGQRVETTINGTNFTLFCCEGNNCNDYPPISVKKSNCYQLTLEGSEGKLRGCKSECHTSNAMCIKKTLYLRNGLDLQMYHCDDLLNQSLCAQHNLTGPGPLCVNVTTAANNNMEICCCKGDYCMKPDKPIEKPNVTDSNTACTLVPIHNKPNHNPTKPTPPGKDDWLFIGGLVGAGVVILLLSGAVVVAVVKVKRKQRRNNRLTLSYTRLAADRIPDDDEDVQMLLS